MTGAAWLFGGPCPFCGSQEGPELFEAWTDHRFTVAACCEAAEPLVAECWRDPDDARGLLRALGAEVLLAPLRRVADDGACGLVLDHRLEVEPIALRDLQAFVAEHHTHNPPPWGWRFGAGLWNGSTLVGAVSVGRPVARFFDQRAVVEVTRLCLRRDVPAPLREHGASKLYGWAAREAKRRGFERIITYTLAEEPGTSLVAAGWSREGFAGGRPWNRPKRPRLDRGPLGVKVRWSRELRPPAAGPLFGPAAAPGPAGARRAA